MDALALPDQVYKRHDGKWCKPCASCGVEQEYLRRNYAIHSFLLGKECKACSNKKTENSSRGFYNGIRSSWVTKCRIGAETRGIEWSLTEEDIWALYVQQDGVCNLSGIPIGWATVGQKHTASLDRIDSAQGYTANNVQLLHKDVNMMKQAFSQDHFVALCASVADKAKW
jgi:hypothetical protein